MRFHACCLLFVLLTGCVVTPKDDSPEAICRRQAYDDPKVKTMTVHSLYLTGNQMSSYDDYDHALHDATQACLIKMGIPAGGVQPVRQY